MSKVFQDIRGDKVIWFIALLLCLASVMVVYSSTTSMVYAHGGGSQHYLVSQLSFILVGAVCTYVCYRLEYMIYYKWALIFFILTIVALVVTKLWGVELNDAKRWLKIPFINKTFQTSDLAKIGLIVYLAQILTKKQEQIKSFREAFIPIIIPVMIVFLLIVSDDFSTAALLFVTCIMMMFIGRVNLSSILLLMVVGLCGFVLIFLLGEWFPDHIRSATWISRFEGFFADTGYQANQSKIAIANGGLLGVGPGHSVQKNYLPFAYADYIYAIICEEYGLIGGVVILGLYLWLLLRCTIMVTKCPKTFGALLAYGLCLNIVLQAFANIAVSVHLLPATGLTLPLISMGGTSLVITCISLGIILSVSRYVQEARMKQIVLSEIEQIDESNN